MSTCAELGITILAYAPLYHGFLSGQIKSFDDLPENDPRRTGPRFQPDVFDENMKLVEEVKKIAQRKGCTVSLYPRFQFNRRAKHYFRWPKSP